MEQTLGERMKEYEFVTRNYLTNRVPIIIRIDGKAFHKFTKGLDKPCDKIFMEAMEQTTIELCKQVQGTVMGYTQSDEISLVLMNTSNKNSELWFNNNLSKIISVSASIATTAFNKAFYEGCAKNDWGEDLKKQMFYADKFFEANFDSRAFNIPEEEIINYFIWRQRDCQKNAVNSAARTLFSHKALQNLNQTQLKEKMLVEKEIDFDRYYKDKFKNGMVIVKEDKERRWTDQNGVVFVGMSKQWVSMEEPKIFEKDFDWFINYLKENK